LKLGVNEFGPNVSEGLEKKKRDIKNVSENRPEPSEARKRGIDLHYVFKSSRNNEIPEMNGVFCFLGIVNDRVKEGQG